MQGEEEEEKEQCSPVSVLDPPFDEDDEHESRDAEEDDKEDEDDGDEDDDDYDMECSYENVQSMLLSLPKFLSIIIISHC